VDEKTSNFIMSLFNTQKLHNEVGLDGNVYSTKRQAAITAVNDVIEESVWFVIVYYFFAVGCEKFCNYLYCDFCWGGIDSLWFCERGI